MTDVVLGSDGLLYVATADAIWTVDPNEAQAGEPSTVTESSSSWRAPLTAVLLAVLAGALIARLAAGRRPKT